MLMGATHLHDDYEIKPLTFLNDDRLVFVDFHTPYALAGSENKNLTVSAKQEVQEPLGELRAFSL